MILTMVNHMDPHQTRSSFGMREFKRFNNYVSISNIFNVGLD